MFSAHKSSKLHVAAPYLLLGGAHRLAENEMNIIFQQCTLPWCLGNRDTSTKEGCPIGLVNFAEPQHCLQESSLMPLQAWRWLAPSGATTGAAYLLYSLSRFCLLPLPALPTVAAHCLQYHLLIAVLRPGHYTQVKHTISTHPLITQYVPFQI